HGPRASVDRVVAAMTEWWEFLCELSKLFAELRALATALPLDVGVERAASRLLTLVVQRTSASDAWYGTFERVLCWYLESAGVDADALGRRLVDMISGRFSSWCEPSEDSARAACAEIGCKVSQLVGTTDVQDSLSVWRVVRREAFNHHAFDSYEPVRF